VSGSLATAFGFGSVHSAFHSSAATVAVNLLLFFGVVFWLGLAWWVYRDAQRRLTDRILIGTATLLGLVPFVGPVVYLLFRPPETLEDVRAREAELRALESRLARREEHCPVCRFVVEPSYLVCPVCTTQLKRACARCSAPLDPLWQACPYCATPASAVVQDLDTALTAELKSTGNGTTRPKRTSRAKPRPRPPAA
jgi:hypothetical protein